MPIIDRDIIEGFRDRGEGVDLDLSLRVSPGKVRDAFHPLPLFEGLQESEHRFLGRVPSHHEVNKGILPEDLLVIVSGRKTAEHDGGLGMKPFDDLGQCESSLDVSHPVQVYSESQRFMLPEEFFHVESVVFQHLERDIDDPHLQAVALQVF